MERYFIDGKEVTKEEAEKQMQKNNRIMAIEDPEEWIKAMKEAKFIIKI